MTRRPGAGTNSTILSLAPSPTVTASHSPRDSSWYRDRRHIAALRLVKQWYRRHSGGLRQFKLVQAALRRPECRLSGLRTRNPSRNLKPEQYSGFKFPAGRGFQCEDDDDHDAWTAWTAGATFDLEKALGLKAAGRHASGWSRPAAHRGDPCYSI